MVESAADRAAMLGDWDEAEIGADTLAGVFEAAYVEALDMESTGPTFTCDAAEAEALGVSRGTALTINATAYTVIGWQPDGTGLVVLTLEAG